MGKRRHCQNFMADFHAVIVDRVAIGYDGGGD
jgi:hypothetical protein